MRVIKNENWHLFLVTGAAVLACLLWSGPIQGRENALRSQDISSPEYRLASAADTDMSGMPPGKKSPLPATSRNYKEFFTGARDPFKPPKSDQLCSAGVVEACNKSDQEQEPSKSGG